MQEAGGRAIKEFEYVYGTTEDGQYRIIVKNGRGKKVKVYTKPTAVEAQLALEQDGFRPIAWAEGRRIVLQGED